MDYQLSTPNNSLGVLFFSSLPAICVSFLEKNDSRCDPFLTGSKKLSYEALSPKRKYNLFLNALFDRTKTKLALALGFGS